jgi:glutamate-5-semialdehyde dehydrogenase
MTAGCRTTFHTAFCVLSYPNRPLRRPSVCNATESILVDEQIASIALNEIIPALQEKGVTVYGCEKTREIVDCEIASDEDFYTEYLDLKISCKIAH